MTSAPGRNTYNVPQTTGNTQYNVRDAALIGASSAFAKPPVKPKPKPNTYTGGGNGALLAATKVGTRTPQNGPGNGSTTPLSRDRTGGSTYTNSERSPTSLPVHSSISSALAVPGDAATDRTPSPSNIAAKLAAARHSPMKLSPQPTSAPDNDTSERDFLPSIGSVSNVLARLDSRPPTEQPLRRRGSAGSQLSKKTTQGQAESHTDSAPMPPTTSLVKMFERAESPVSTQPSAEAPPPVKSPKPRRIVKASLPLEGSVDVKVNEAKTQPPPPVKAKPVMKPTPKPKPRSLSIDGGGDDQEVASTPKTLQAGFVSPKQKPVQFKVVKTTGQRPQTPTRSIGPKTESPSDIRRTPSRRLSAAMSAESNDHPSSPSSFVSAKEEQDQRDEKQKPTLPPPRRSVKAKSSIADTEKRSTSAPEPPKPRSLNGKKSPLQLPEKFEPIDYRPAHALHPTRSSDTLYHSNYQRESAKNLTKHLTGESLSSAIVGAALASSRNPSPGRTSSAIPPLPARKHHHHHLHHSPLHHDRSPSPQKPPGKLRSTLRREPSTSSDEDESEKYKKKGTRVMGMRKKHPNKHHEGTRKRWRDAITERERKRYEGVWAANKGLFILPSRDPNAEDPTNDVLNLIVKDIWMRSRLAEHVLEEVWDLVDGRGIGRLCREEFVVGMWLIDQRLKGRKLPFKVSDSVWDSVRGVGVKVKVRPKR